LRGGRGDRLRLVRFAVVVAHSHAAEPDGRDFQIPVSKFALLHFLDVVVVRPNHSGVAGVSGITRGASLTIVRSLSRSCAKKGGPPYKPLLSDSELNATESPKLFATEKKSRDIIVLLLE